MSPRLAPLSDEPYSAIACFSSAISSALTESPSFRPALSICTIRASILSPTE